MKKNIWTGLKKPALVLVLTILTAVALSAQTAGSSAYETGDDVIVNVSEQKFALLTLESYCSHTGNMLPGAVISVEHTSGWNDTVELETGTAPVHIPERNAGIYTIRDVKAPDGYISADPDIKLIVGESDMFVQETIAIFYNPLNTGTNTSRTQHGTADEPESGTDSDSSSNGNQRKTGIPADTADPGTDPDGAGVPRTGGSRNGNGLRFLTVIIAGVVIFELAALEVIKSRE